jgi:hypothetical protein
MKALIFLLIAAATLSNTAAQAQDRDERPSGILQNKREQWVKHSRAQTCYRLPGGRITCSQRQQTNPSNGQ